MMQLSMVRLLVSKMCCKRNIRTVVEVGLELLPVSPVGDVGNSGRANREDDSVIREREKMR
jgi:hypothetical protein